MAKIQETHTYAGKSAGDVYQAALKAAPQAGLEIWKRRDIAWLAMVRCGSGSEAIDGSVSARAGANGCAVTVSLSTPAADARASQAELRARAERIFAEISRILG